MSPDFKPKKVPVITWDNITPPYKDYVYFEHWQDFPFHWNAMEYNLSNAWWLCEAALLAYADEDFVRPRFLGAGFEEVEFFNGPSTQCYVAASSSGILVTFRGTQCNPQALRDTIADLKSDFDIRFAATGHGGCIHNGFKTALDEVWTGLSKKLKELTRQDRPLWVTGHSLGGALAIVTADRLSTLQGVYTFGAPRVGDSDFVEQLDVPLYCFVNNNDVVPHVPPPPYCDAGRLRYIDNKGRIHEQINFWERWLDEMQGRLYNLVDTLHHGLPAMIPDGLKDHTPLLYAAHVWNNLIR